jgi:hypothetical protein
MPRRIAAAEATLSGRRPGEAVFREAAAAAAAAIDPIEDAQTNAQYRRRTGRRYGLSRSDPGVHARLEKSSMSELVNVTLVINGLTYTLQLEPRRTLLDAIWEECGSTEPTAVSRRVAPALCCRRHLVRACLMFAVQAQGSVIRTVEGRGWRDLEPLHAPSWPIMGCNAASAPPAF